MARGAENQPKHAGLGGDCKIVLYEQDKHRSVSKSNGKGFFGGKGGPDWQSHHIICLMATGEYRKVSDSDQKKYLEETLWSTEWNINEAPNMIGLPTRSWYRKEYSDDNFTPVNLPSHNNDHNITGGYLDEIKGYLKKNVWDKFNPKKKDHNKDPGTLKAQLESTSKHFEGILLGRGKRNKGTISSWKTRFEDNIDKDARKAAYGGTRTPKSPSPHAPDKPNLWYFPFSMSRRPKPRSPGQKHSDMTWLFSSEFWK